MADQVAHAAPFHVSTLLQALVELPVGGEGDPLRASAQQFNSHWTGHGSGCSRTAEQLQTLRSGLLIACSEGYDFRRCHHPVPWLPTGKQLLADDATHPERRGSRR